MWILRSQSHHPGVNKSILFTQLTQIKIFNNKIYFDLSHFNAVYEYLRQVTDTEKLILHFVNHMPGIVIASLNLMIL